jgi:hypothetical protein
MLMGVPAEAKTALVLMDDGPAGLGAEWQGYDMRLPINLTNAALAGPRLGAGSEGYLSNLLSGGFAREPWFGGVGADCRSAGGPVGPQLFSPDLPSGGTIGVPHSGHCSLLARRS